MPFVLFVLVMFVAFQAVVILGAVALKNSERNMVKVPVRSYRGVVHRPPHRSDNW